MQYNGYRSIITALVVVQSCKCDSLMYVRLERNQKGDFNITNKLAVWRRSLSHVCSGDTLQKLKDSVISYVYKACVFRAYFHVRGKGSL